VYARLAYSPYAGHALQAKPASARRIRQAVGQSTCADSIRVYSRAYICRDGWHAGLEDQAVRAKWDSYGERFEHTIHCSLDAGIDEVETVAEAPAVAVCAIGQPVSDGRYGYASQSSYADAKLPMCVTSMPFGMAGMPKFLQWETPAAGASRQPMSNGVKSKPIGVAGLVPSGITSMPFWTTGMLRLERPELPGTSMRLDTLCLLEQSELPYMLFGVVLLVSSGNINMHLTGVTSLPFAAE